MSENIDKIYDLPPDVEKYLESVDDGTSVTLDGLMDLLQAVMSKSSIDNERVKIITRLFFQEMRTALLRGEAISIKKLGKFKVYNPNDGSSKKRVFLKFKPSPQIIKDINE